MNKKIAKLVILVGFVVGFGMLGYHYLFENDDTKVTSSSQSTSTSSSTSTSTTSQSSDLPDVSSSDWELVLVNRDNMKPEMNPDLVQIDNISVDARIADNVSQFLQAAQAIDASEHLISGYRSVAYQKTLFSSYVETEMANDPNLTESEAETIVKTYSQPAGASEHQTGLAIDMSTVDLLNQSDPTVTEQVQALAPKYGFVLRFTSDTSDSTGVNYEDWHYRYVGKASAEYMTNHHLTLEEYLKLLKENGR